MAKLGWGTPSIITVELGLLLDLPNPMFAIVGVLKRVLPAEEAPILRLQVNFIGVLDFEHGYLFFRADLFDSRLLVYTITGSMALPGLLGRAEDVRAQRRRLPPRLPRHPEHPRAARRLPQHGADRHQPAVGRQPAPEGRVVLRGHVEHRAVRRAGRALRSGRRVQRLRLPRLRRPVPVRSVPLRRPAVRRHCAPRRGRRSSPASTSPRSCPDRRRGMRAARRAELLFFEISVGFHVTWGDPPPAHQPRRPRTCSACCSASSPTRATGAPSCRRTITCT